MCVFGLHPVDQVEEMVKIAAGQRSDPPQEEQRDVTSRVSRSASRRARLRGAGSICLVSKNFPAKRSCRSWIPPNRSPRSRRGAARRSRALQGRIVFNLFFENSTRTRTSFSLAAKRLSADTQDFSPSGSSLSKGESFIDTARNIEAMGADVVVIRHPTPGTPHLLVQHLKCSIINAGDGAHEHPTQGLLDLMTIRRAKGRIDGLTVGLVGDIAHSRVARSNIWGLTQAGGQGHPVRAADPGAQGMGTAGLRGRLSP